MQSGLVSNIQKFSVQDGPGIRTTVFLKGCPLSCWWCHNPEGRLRHSEIIVIETRCIRCGGCVEVCTDGSSSSGEFPWRGSEDCRLCGSCVDACPTGARQMIGARMTVEEVMSEILKDEIFYDDSGGGVTFSGGEPLMQPQFLRSLLEECRTRGIHTAVDTCGYAPFENIMAVAWLTDLFLYDLKIMDDNLHLHYTGVSNEVILQNLRSLGRIHDNIWIRIPIIPGVNDSDDQLEKMGAFAAGIGSVRQVNLLPYHATGIPKFRRLGEVYRLPELKSPTSEFMEALVGRFAALGLNARAGG
jgi:pyruvate formate lyase activating enzyme